jgi:hypothetical protein
MTPAATWLPESSGRASTTAAGLAATLLPSLLSGTAPLLVVAGFPVPSSTGTMML